VTSSLSIKSAWHAHNQMAFEISERRAGVTIWLYP